MFVHAATQSLCLQVPDPFEIRDLIPQSKTLDHPIYNVALKHTWDAVRVLRNLGFKAPYPDDYNWPGKYMPMEHQRTMVEFYMNTHRGFNLSEMGTGKTAATLWAADRLMQSGQVKKALVLCPLSTCERVWMQDIFDVLMHRRAAVCHGTKDGRLKAFATNSDFYILNHDGVTIKEIKALLMKRKDINLVIVDEGSMFRNHDTEKFKALRDIIQPHQRLWWITGTPFPNAPTDAWAQCRLVNPKRVPVWPGQFKRQTMMQLTPFKWAPRIGAEKIAYDAMQPAVRFLKKDCMDLPPVTFMDRQATLSKEQRDAFDKMRKEMTTEIGSNQITAVNAADKINKARQILCGSIKDPTTGNYVVLDYAPRLKVLKETIQSASAKVIVVVPYKGIIQDLAKSLEAKDAKGNQFTTVGVLNGDVSPKMRDRIIVDFKTQTDPHVLLCHPKVMSHGLNLTEADTLIFYAPIYSNDEFQQVVERFNRAGQKRKMTVIRIAAHPLEWGVYKMVDNKRITQQNILDLYATITEE